MVGGVRWSLVGSVILGSFGVVGVLAGCSGGFFTAERETWRHEAEVQCLASGAVKETANVVRIQAIQGPGMCGADFPLKVSMLGEGGSLGYSQELRPPGSIPNAAQPRWPGTTRSAPADPDSPVSLTAPGAAQTPAAGVRTLRLPQALRRGARRRRRPRRQIRRAGATCASRRRAASTFRRCRMSAGA